MSKEKISSQEIIDHVSTKASVSKRAAEEFLKVMISTIEDALLAGEVVKIKGFGTFKLQWNEPRKSVNVQTGEEIILDGYQKVTFTPETSLKELVNEPFAHLEPVLLDADNNFIVPDEPGGAVETLDPLRVFAEQATEINDLLSELRAMSVPAVVMADDFARNDGLYESGNDRNDVVDIVDAVELPDFEFNESFEEKDDLLPQLQAEYIFDDNASVDVYPEKEGAQSESEVIDELPAAAIPEVDSAAVVSEALFSILTSDVDEFESDYEPVVVLPVVEEFDEEEIPTEHQSLKQEYNIEDYRLVAEHPEIEMPEPGYNSTVSMTDVSVTVSEVLSEPKFTSELVPEVEEVASDVAPVAVAADEEVFVYKPRVVTVVEDKPTVVYERNEDEELDLDKTPFMQGAKKKRRRTAFWIVFLITLVVLVAAAVTVYSVYQPATSAVNDLLGIQSARVTVKVAPRPKPAPKVAKTVVIPKDTTKKDTFKVAEATSKTASKEQKQVVDTLQQLFEKRSYGVSIATEQAKKDSKLTNMALKYYGHKDFWVFIYEANKERIDDPEHLQNGTLIRIPKLDKKLINPDDSRCLSKARDLGVKYTGSKKKK